MEWKRGFILSQAYSSKNNARLVVMMPEVLSFPSNMSNVVNSLETTERKIKEFERHANIDITPFDKFNEVNAFEMDGENPVGGSYALVLVKEQLKEELGRPQGGGSCCSKLFGRVLWNTRRQSQLESEPCEAVRSNPSRQHRVAG